MKASISKSLISQFILFGVLFSTLVSCAGIPTIEVRHEAPPRKVVWVERHHHTPHYYHHRPRYRYHRPHYPHHHHHPHRRHR